MGDPKKLKRKYESPRKIWDKDRIEEEHKLVEEFGLKNLRELRIMQMELKRIRREARRLLSLGDRGGGWASLSSRKSSGLEWQSRIHPWRTCCHSP